ncbi:hypothetical protein RF11_04743 [Thelohanellus kitauei]|uniref:Transposon Ty3-I Gag-Pol polyprotein n=1 Tax=Thelohanellus kitauei TaxID=669202 RepID=A0A0C2JP22_THEKT|nr:hypothetical protein RF11_04743 [Thelohanellus kitauei]
MIDEVMQKIKDLGRKPLNATTSEGVAAFKGSVGTSFRIYGQKMVILNTFCLKIDNFISIDFFANGNRCRGILDTGSTASLISLYIYNKSFCIVPISTSKRRSSAQTKTMECIGSIELSVEYANKTSFVQLFIVDNLIRDFMLRIDLMKEFEISIFLSKPKTIKGYFHDIKQTSSTFCKIRSHPLPLHNKTEIEKQIALLLENEIIHPSSNSFCALIVIMTKKRGEIRISEDYIALNIITKKIAYPLSLVTDLQNKLSIKCVFSALDLKCGYWKIPVNPRDIEKTAFCFGSEYGLFEFKAMQFGLTGTT